MSVEMINMCRTKALKMINAQEKRTDLECNTSISASFLSFHIFPADDFNTF